MPKKLLSTLAIAGVCSWATAGYAQSVTPQQRTPGTAPGQQHYVAGQQQGALQGQGANLDQKIAACLVLGNQEEVALAQFAQQHAKSKEVKRFADMMIEQHQQAIAKIQQAVPQIVALRLNLTGAQNAPNLQAASAPGQTGNAMDQQALALAQATKQECLALTQRELGEHQGAEFDACYLGQQIGAHIGMLAELRASEKFASGQLRQVIQAGQKMTEDHLAHAKKLMDSVKDEGRAGAQTSQRQDREKSAR